MLQITPQWVPSEHGTWDARDDGDDAEVGVGSVSNGRGDRCGLRGARCPAGWPSGSSCSSSLTCSGSVRFAYAMCRKSAIVAIVGACISAGECSPIARTMQIPPACRPKTAAFSAGQVGWQSCDAQFLTHDFGTVDKRAGQAWNCVCGCNCPHGLPRTAPTGAKSLRSTPITPASRGARRRR